MTDVNYSIQACSKNKSTGNIVARTVTGQGCGETGVQKFQKDTLDSVETIIQNVNDPDYTIETPNQGGGNGDVYVEIQYNDPWSFGSGLVTLKIYPGSNQVSLDSGTENFYPYTASPIVESSVSVTIAYPTFTFQVYQGPGLTGSIIFDISFNIETVVTASGLVLADPDTLFPGVYLDNGLSPVVRERQAGITEDGTTYSFGDYGQGDAQLYAVYNVLKSTVPIPTVSTDPLYLFHVPEGVTQTEPPSVDLFRRFLLKEDALTEGTTTLITDTAKETLFDYISKELFQTLRLSSKTIEEEPDELDDCGGRYSGGVSNYCFTFRSIVQ